MKRHRHEELRKLPAATLHEIADILEFNNDWQKVMFRIPKDPNNNRFEPKYNSEHMRLIEEHAKNTNRKCADVLFDEWATSGRVRPTLGTLRDVLLNAKQYRAADKIATILQEALPERPQRGPEAKIDTNITSILNDESMEQRLNSMSSVTSDNFKTKFTNGTTPNHVLCNGTTKQMKSASQKSFNLIQFSTVNQSNDVLNKSQQSSAQSFSGNGNSNKMLDSQYFPDFSKLLPKSHENQTICTSSTSDMSTINGSEYSDTTDGIAESEQSYTGKAFEFNSLSCQIDSGILEDAKLIQFQYKDLENITNNFSENLVQFPEGPSGKIGRGGFGDVFAGPHSKYGILAVKRVRSHPQTECTVEMTLRFFNTEVKSLSQLRHNNIVPILGFSFDGPAPCIVCKYIEGGSLEQKIQKKVLSEKERINIMLGTAEALKYIHNSVQSTETESSSKYYLHGDVKSANILLTEDCVPKICDFGLSRKYDATFITKSIKGTSAYMAPECFSGTITQKNDVFSFGIVLLELLTGLKPIIIDNSESKNIKDYVDDYCENNDISGILDPVVDKWTKAGRVYQLAKHCLQREKNDRPSMNEVCYVLNGLNYEHYEFFYGSV